METNRREQVPSGRADARVARPSKLLAGERRMRSLARANEIRSARATLKKDLAAGRAQIEEVLGQPPAFAATAKVYDLLRAAPGFGPARTTRSLARCQIPYAKTAAGLSERQRHVLIALLRASG